MTLISPGDWALQCGMWLWNHGSEFTKWQHPAVWYVALGWHAVEFAGGSNLQCGRWLWDDMPWNSPKRPPYWKSTYGFHLHTSPQSTCHSVPVCEILSKSDHQAEKMTSCRFSRWRISAILDCRDPIMGSLKSPVKLTQLPIGHQ